MSSWLTMGADRMNKASQACEAKRCWTRWKKLGSVRGVLVLERSLLSVKFAKQGLQLRRARKEDESFQQAGAGLAAS